MIQIFNYILTYSFNTIGIWPLASVFNLELESQTWLMVMACSRCRKGHHGRKHVAA